MGIYVYNLFSFFFLYLILRRNFHVLWVPFSHPTIDLLSPHWSLIRSGDKSLYKLRNVPRIFDLRSKSSFLDHSSFSFCSHLLIALSRSTIPSFSDGYKNCIKSAWIRYRRYREARRGDQIESLSFRRIEIETRRCFTICTLRRK